jgi:hypothetical protein
MAADQAFVMGHAAIGGEDSRRQVAHQRTAVRRLVWASRLVPSGLARAGSAATVQVPWFASAHAARLTEINHCRDQPAVPVSGPENPRWSQVDPPAQGGGPDQRR